MTTTERVEVLIVGAGLSGIGAAHHLCTSFPERNFTILESRDAIGGTWDLFRYPGVRSDSDMHTLGYRFRPWTAAKSIADGPSILDYIASTASRWEIASRTRLGHKVVAAEWSSSTSTWRVEVQVAGETTWFECSILMLCSGYYSYEKGYTPDFPGIENFGGPIIHPQKWPAELDYSNKRVTVIGSGATAVTLVPALAAQASHVTMLQRSPTYIMSTPSEDKMANLALRLLGSRAAYRLTRWKNVATSWGIYELSRRRPNIIKAMVRKNVVDSLPKGYDVDTHFSPDYQPWDQRLCAAPDGDFFASLSTDRASVVTDTISRFNSAGIQLTSGRQLDADIIVTATGLDMLFFGGIDLTVDGREISPSDTFAYKGMMLSGVPNLIYTLGYTNSSWTLKADLVSQYTCRLLAHMDKHTYRTFVAIPETSDMARRPLFDFDAGYVKRAVDRMPNSGPRAPWRQSMNYYQDVITMRHRPIEDGVLRFSHGDISMTGERPARNSAR